MYQCHTAVLADESGGAIGGFLGIALQKTNQIRGDIQHYSCRAVLLIKGFKNKSFIDIALYKFTTYAQMSTFHWICSTYFLFFFLPALFGFFHACFPAVNKIDILTYTKPNLAHHL